MKPRTAIFSAILAAALYALNAPLSKLLLSSVPPSMMAAFLYLGAVLVLLACCCWGMENNCTRMLSQSNPQEIVIVKGLGSGAGALVVALLTGEAFSAWQLILPALLLGFVAYGLSIFFYVYAQRYLGAARTSAYYAISPFLGVLLSLVISRKWPGDTAAGAWMFLAALVVMIVATILVTRDGFRQPDQE